MKNLLLLLLIMSSLILGCRQNLNQDNPHVNDIENIITKSFEGDQIAGMSVAVLHKGVTLLKKGYGFADLEHQVETPDEASYEIGSVTKQFTSVAVLQLVERGKLSLDDDLTKYVDFDTGGRNITIERLMNHTSGIRGYTEMSNVMHLASQKLPRDTLLRLVESEEFDFEPGEASIYNNTAFFILGLIIEAVSEQTYEEYLSEHLFEPAGMTNSYYCSENKIVPKRAHGYDMGREGLVRKAYLDHLWPYAAGSICSTTGDLIKWNQALHGGAILSQEMYEELLEPAELNDGTKTRYAKGLAVTTSKGHKLIAHGGGIFGFLSDVRWYPDEELLIIALANTAGPVNPSAVTSQIADLFLEEINDPEVEFEGDLSEFEGSYMGLGRGRDLTVEIRAEAGVLSYAIGDGDSTLLQFSEGLKWINAGTWIIFKKDASDNVNELRFDQGAAHYVLKKQEK